MPLGVGWVAEFWLETFWVGLVTLTSQPDPIQMHISGLENTLGLVACWSQSAVGDTTWVYEF